MVWARKKLMIQDDLLKPRNKIEINYSGPNPERFYEEIPKLVMSVFKVSENDIHEKKFVWSHGEPQRFKVEWEITKDLDMFSYYYIEISLSGSSSKGIGTVNITIEGLLRTEYPQDTFWQRSFIYEVFRMFWHRSFYVSKRQSYVLEGRRLILLLAEEIKRFARTLRGA
jgi:hypothetical protein